MGRNVEINSGKRKTIIMSYDKQVEKQHYHKRTYNSIHRFVSYYGQIDHVLTALPQPASILEIGKGNGLVNWYLKQLGYNAKTFDFDPGLEPDFQGDMLNIDTIVHEKFDAVCAFEVLEHVKYEDVEGILLKMAKVSNKYVIISLPQFNFVVSFWLRISRFRDKRKVFLFPWPKPHRFDGEHYWELGKIGYKISDFRNMLNKHFTIVKEYTEPLDTYHRFYILEKK